MNVVPFPKWGQFFARCRLLSGLGLVLLLAWPLVAVGDEPPVAGLQYPLAVTVGPDGTIYVADLEMHGVWQLKDGQLSPYYQGSKKFRTPLNAVRCLAIDKEGRLLAGDSATREVYRFTGPGEMVPLTKGHVGIPMCLGVASDGSIVVSDIEIQRLMRIPAAGGEPQEIKPLAAVRGLVVDTDDQIYALAHQADSLFQVAPDGSKQEVLLKGRAFQFSHHLVKDANGDFWTVDGYAKGLYRIPKTGEAPVAAHVGPPLKNPVGLARDGDSLLIADPHAKGIFRYDPAKPEGERLIQIFPPAGVPGEDKLAKESGTE